MGMCRATVSALVWTCTQGCLCWVVVLEETRGSDCSVLFLDHLCKSQIGPETLAKSHCDFSWEWVMITLGPLHTNLHCPRKLRSKMAACSPACVGDCLSSSAFCCQGRGRLSASPINPRPCPRSFNTSLDGWLDIQR